MSQVVDTLLAVAVMVLILFFGMMHPTGADRHIGSKEL